MRFTYNAPELKGVRQKLRRNSTIAEKILWQYLRGSRLGIRFFRQYSIGRYVADFCCPAKRLVIEIDGITHDAPAVQRKDAFKQTFLEQLGYQVLRFSDGEVKENPEGIAIYIGMIISNPSRPPLTTRGGD